MNTFGEAKSLMKLRGKVWRVTNIRVFSRARLSTDTNHQLTTSSMSRFDNPFDAGDSNPFSVSILTCSHFYPFNDHPKIMLRFGNCRTRLQQRAELLLHLLTAIWGGSMQLGRFMIRFFFARKFTIVSPLLITSEWVSDSNLGYRCCPRKAWS